MTDEVFFEKYMKHLSAQQREAVTATEGPVLLLAVPGGGKTTVLVTRLGYMILCRGINPREILTLTYTVAATRDMAARYREIFTEGNRGIDPGQAGAFGSSGRAADLDCLDASGMPARFAVPEFRTINGICARIIIRYGQRIGKQPFALETDEKKLTAVLGSIYRKIEGDYAGEAELGEIRRRIAFVKNMMLSEEAVFSMDEEAGCHFSEICAAYNQYLRAERRMDYDDQMVYAHTILKNSPDTLRFFQNEYRYICVDEAQDTSRIQHEIIRLLSRDNENLFMVGDEDQSIYGFRAAYPEALLDFEKDHPGARVLLMEDNFRSNARIVRAAERFIGCNQLRHDKDMRASRAEGPAVRMVDVKGRGAQYTYLAKALSELKEQTAVLYRDNESLIPLADLFERRGIPYRVRNSELSFFGSRVVTDITNIIRFAFDPSDAEFFSRIYYKLQMYITKAQMERLCEENAGKKRSLLTAAITGTLVSPGARQSLRTLREHFHALTEDSAGDAVRRISKEMGYSDYLERSGISDRRLRVLQMLARRETSAESLLARLDELRDLLSNKENDPDCPLILSTIHSSKGLEYENVWLIDVLDGIFPEKAPDSRTLAKWRKRGRYSKEELADVRTWEEERRLFYVGVTRAKKNLNIFRVAGKSKFADEFGQYVQVDALPVTGRGAGTPKPRKGRASARRIEDDEGYLEFCRELGEGVMVEHETFGEGVVVDLDDQTVTVLFGNRRKRLGLGILYQKGLLWII